MFEYYSSIVHRSESDSTLFQQQKSTQFNELPALSVKIERNNRMLDKVQDDYDLETVFQKKIQLPELVLPKQGDSYMEKVQKDESLKATKKNTKIVKGLHEDIISENETLKYEYIQMIQNGKERDFLMNILSSKKNLFFN